MPILEEKDPRIAIEYLLGVLNEIDEESAKTVIVDRLHSSGDASA